MKEIPLSVPNLNIEIVDNLRECVETGWVSTGGRFISEFEEKVAQFVKIDEGVACQSGTAGIHTALRLLDVGYGDEVIVPSLTFIAAINPIKYLGAEPVFIDCDESLCLDPIKLRGFLENECTVEEDKVINKSSKRAIKTIVVVHVLGFLADMASIMEVAEEYNLKVLEDASEALGSYWITGKCTGKYAGTVAHLGVYSFNANKIITTGGGGMIVSGYEDETLRQSYLKQARYLTTTAKDDGLYFVHDEVGYNYRMLNLQAALGVSQIERLSEFIEAKKRNFNLYKQQLSKVKNVELLSYGDDISSNYWFYSLLICDEKSTLDGNNQSSEEKSKRNLLLDYLIENGVQSRPLWKLSHTQKPYINAQTYEIEKSFYYEENIVNIPCSTNLTEDEINYVCSLIADFMK